MMFFHKKILCASFVFFLFLTPECEAKDKNKKEGEFAIHTYGGGDLLTRIFNTLAMVIYGNQKTGLGKTFNGVVRIALVIGGFSTVCLAFFREKFEPFIKQFFLPGIGIVTILLVPRTTVTIYDHLVAYDASTQRASVVQVANVPLFLCQFASLVSTLSYTLTDLLTNAAHGVNDPMYNWTGQIFAAENIFRTKKSRITNPIVEENLREFCRECVFRDIGLGLYSKDELIHEKNILNFLSRNTSNLRTVLYRDSFKGSRDSEYVTCKESISRINAILSEPSTGGRDKLDWILGKQENNTKSIVFGEMGNELQFLIDQKNAGQQSIRDLVKQQIAVSYLKEEIPGSFDSFAAKRAEILQKENQKILGALGVKSIVGMRNFFEGVIYLIFPLIVVVSLMSFGFKSIIQWLHFVIWVNTWPIFYVVINFLLNSIWSSRKQLLGEDGNFLTIFSSEGLGDLYSSMESIAAIAMAFIPFLSWMLIKGGLSQFVQLASSLTAPAQGAASVAAGEYTSGNHSYGNVSFDNTNGFNTQTFKQSTSGQLSQGSIALDTASQSLNYDTSNDKIFFKQSDSYLREGISKTDAFASSLQTGLAENESILFDASKSYSDSLTATSNKAVGLMEAISKHQQTGVNLNSQEMTSFQESYQYIQGLSEDYAKATGVSKDEAIREVVSGGLSGGFAAKLVGLKGGYDVSYQDGVTQNDSSSFSERGFDSKSIQDHLQTIRNASEGTIASFMGSEDAKLHKDFSESFNTTESSLNQLREAYSRQETLSNVKNYAESSSLNVQQNLNQSFVEFLRGKFDGDISKLTDATDLSAMNPEKRKLIDEFVLDYLPSKFSHESLQSKYQDQERFIPDVNRQLAETSQAELHSTGKEKVGFDFGAIKDDYQRIQSDVNKASLGDKSYLREGRSSLSTGQALDNAQEMKGLSSLKEEINNGVKSENFKLTDFAIYELGRTPGYFAKGSEWIGKGLRNTGEFLSKIEKPDFKEIKKNDISKERGNE